MVFPIVAPPDPRGPWFVQTWIYTILGSFCVNLSFFGFVVLEKKFFFFKWIHPIFCIFMMISPLKRTWPLICTMLNSLYLKIICIMFDRNWLDVLEKIKKKISQFLLFCYYLPLVKGVVLHFYNSESLNICLWIIYVNFG
jgi:hypothetical protein